MQTIWNEVMRITWNSKMWLTLIQNSIQYTLMVRDICTALKIKGVFDRQIKFCFETSRQRTPQWFVDWFLNVQRAQEADLSSPFWLDVVAYLYILHRQTDASSTIFIKLNACMHCIQLTFILYLCLKLFKCK